VKFICKVCIGGITDTCPIRAKWYLIIVSSLMGGLASAVYAVHMLSPKLSLRVNVKEIVKPLIPPTISSVLAYTSMMMNLFWVQAILGPVISLTTWFDISNIRG